MNHSIIRRVNHDYPIRYFTVTNKFDTAKKLGTQVLFFISGNVYTLIVGFTLQLYVAKTLGAHNLGIFSLLEAGVAIVAGFLGFGIAPTLVKYIPVHLEKKEYSNVKRLLKVCFFTLLISGLLAIVLIYLLFPIVLDYWPNLAEHKVAALTMLLMIPISLISFYYQQGLRGFQEFKHMILGATFIQLTLKVILVVFFFSGGILLMGYIWAVILSAFISLLWMAYGLRKKVKAMPMADNVENNSRFLEWKNYSVVMYSSSFVSNSMSYLDRFLIGFFVSANAVGVYVVARMLVQLPLVFFQLLMSVAAPMFSAAHSKDDSEEIQHLYHLVTDWVTRASLPLILFMAVFAQEILDLYGEEFSGTGYWTLLILLFGQFINLVTGPVGMVMNMTGYEKILFKFTLYQTLLGALALLLLTPMLGLFGAAASMSITVSIYSLATLYYAKTKMDLRWYSSRFKRWIPATLACLGTITALKLLDIDNGIAFLCGCLILAYVVFHGLSYLLGLHEDDKVLLGHIRNKLKGKLVQ